MRDFPEIPIEGKPADVTGEVPTAGGEQKQPFDI